jgi:hypothetical protein
MNLSGANNSPPRIMWSQGKASQLAMNESHKSRGSMRSSSARAIARKIKKINLKLANRSQGSTILRMPQGSITVPI